MTLSPTTPPEKLCILRLSALGDITHTLPLVQTIQQHWPATKISWIIGKTEYQLVRDVPDIEFIIFDKSLGVFAYNDVRRKLKGQRFDVLMHIQLSLRASLVSALVSADIKLGFDRERAKDLQWLFSNEKIKPLSTRQHVVDSFVEFARHFGLEPVMQWKLPVSRSAITSIKQHIPEHNNILVINPCALAKARGWRNWHSAGYAAVANYAASQHNMTVVLTGGPTEVEQQMAADIIGLCQTKPVNLVGQTSIDELVAVIDIAKVMIAPDTGPAHIGNALGTPVIGLYAATNPDRAAPYRYQDYVVNKYPEALQKYYQLDVDTAVWGMRIRNSECMDMITADEVNAMLDKVIATL